MKILHLLSGGGIGGIEMLCKDVASCSTNQNEFCFLFNGGSISDEIEQDGGKIYRLYKQNKLLRFFRLFLITRKNKYDIVVVHHEGVGIYSFYLFLRFLFPRSKYIKYLHCSYERKYLTNRHYHLLKYTINKSDHLIAVSEFVRQSYLNEFHFKENKISVIYNGIQESYILQNKPEELPQIDVPTLLYVGRLTEVKGIRILLEAMILLKKEQIEPELEILGDGPERKELEQITRDRGIHRQVHFRGYQLDKKEYYHKTQIFIYPSIWQEAFGISIVEALAEGMICIGSRTGGIPEIISDGFDGYLFTPGDVKALADTIKKAIILCKSDSYLEMRRRAKRRAGKFSVTRMTESHRLLCDRVVKEIR